MDIRFSGFGGQGIIKSGTLVGRAASLFDNKFATMTQNFGPEARGGACSAQIVIDREPVLYPYIISPDILVVMSQEAYEKFIDEPKKGSIILIDKDLVRPKKDIKYFNMYAIPATRIAEEMGNRIFANVIMVGFFIAITEVVSLESMKKALPGTVPDRFLPNNIDALEKGYEFGLGLIKKKKTISSVQKPKVEKKQIN